MVRDKMSFAHQLLELLAVLSLVGFGLQVVGWIVAEGHWPGGGTCWLSFVLCLIGISVTHELRRLRHERSGSDSPVEAPRLAAKPGIFRSSPR